MDAGWQERLRGGVIVSCQARAGHPLHDPVVIAAMARAAVAGGAVGLRINGEADLREVRRGVDVPLIGLRKMWSAESPVYITPTFADAKAIADAGADIVALDATARPRPGGERLDDLIPRIHQLLGRPVMADVATLDEGMRAAALGADIVSTTLSGYTGQDIRGTGRLRTIRTWSWCATWQVRCGCRSSRKGATARRRRWWRRCAPGRSPSWLGGQSPIR